MTFQDLSNNYSIKWSTSVNDINLSYCEDILIFSRLEPLLQEHMLLAVNIL